MRTFDWTTVSTWKVIGNISTGWICLVTLIISYIIQTIQQSFKVCIIYFFNAHTFKKRHFYRFHLLIFILILSSICIGILMSLNIAKLWNVYLYLMYSSVSNVSSKSTLSSQAFKAIVHKPRNSIYFSFMCFFIEC